MTGKSRRHSSRLSLVALLGLIALAWGWSWLCLPEWYWQRSLDDWALLYEFEWRPLRDELVRVRDTYPREEAFKVMVRLFESEDNKLADAASSHMGSFEPLGSRYLLRRYHGPKLTEREGWRHLRALEEVAYRSKEPVDVKIDLLLSAFRAGDVWLQLHIGRWLSDNGKPDLRSGFCAVLEHGTKEDRLLAFAAVDCYKGDWCTLLPILKRCMSDEDVQIASASRKCYHEISVRCRELHVEKAKV